MFNYLATKFRDPTPISIPNEKPVEASSYDKTQESCTKPEELSVEPPSEERLKDILTEASSEEEAEAAVGGTLQWLTASSQEVENGESVLSMPTGHAGKVNSCMRQHIPKVQRVPLKGELAGCVSDSTGHMSSNKRNLQGHTNTSRVQGMHPNGSSGQEEPIDPQVKSTGHNGKDNMTSSGNINSERVEAALLARESQDTYQGQNKQGDLPVSSWHLTTTQARSYKAIRPRHQQGQIKIETGNARILHEGPEGIRKWGSVNMNVSSQIRGPEGQDKANKRLGVIIGIWKFLNNGK
ncbi:hypothetical protein EDD16DRAFT_1515391 [Pisolithus croceorrhizus]|nr:hypothetical protein EDD16DRAFT_1515391 [Pisolithus croceorrhizus]KAI6131362.1 hypothetical protein EV401DRAFT_1884051 [Pisolithus croceorrhizus]